MVSQKYRWDFIGLSTDTKPTSETSDKVVNGSTYYCSDTSKLYVYCDGTWYERKPLGGGGGGGTSDFNDLSNRPKYNGSDMTGTTNIPEVVTYSDFTGTDGTAAGTAGLVPAPATTDAGKFLGASGLWEAVQAGGVTELTTADYNWNSVAGDSTTTPFNSVAIGLLDDGVYTCKDNVNIAIHPSPNFPTFTTISIIIVSKDSTSVSVPNRRKVIYLRDDKLYVGTANFIDGTGSDYHYLLDQYSLTNSLTSSSTTTALTANQGKTLKDLIDSLVIKGTGAPTTSTVGSVGKLYEDTTNGDLYICTDATNPYVWEEVGAGGGGGPTVVQTTGTSTTDVMSQNATSSMVFAEPSSKTKVQIGDRANAGANTGNATIAIGSSAKAYQNGSDGSSVIYPTAVGPEATAKGNRSLALGANSLATCTGSVAVGAGANATSVGQFDIGSQYTSYGYNSSNYRLLTGLYDGQSAHDAATVAQGNTLSTSAPTTSTVGVLGQLYTDTTNMHTYQCTAISGDTYTWTQRW